MSSQHSSNSIANFPQIPAELKERPQWVLWRKELRDGKLTKVPYNARTGKKAQTNNSKTWSTFAQAAAALANSDHYHGVGYIFSADDPYVGIDLDDCIDESGEIAHWAREFIDLVRTYWERSQSGSGVHGIAKGKLPPEGRKKSPIEMYMDKRLFAMTGDRLEGTSETIQDCSEQILTMHARVWPPKEKSAPQPRRAAAPLDLDDAALLDKARQASNGDLFRQLYDHGDVSRYGGDDSSADLALCNILAFWCQCDAGRMDQIFRRSALVRDKWTEREDYRNRTIQEAISSCREVYTPSRNGANAQVDADDQPPHPATRVVPRDEPASTPVDLASTMETVRKWLYLTDDGHIKFTLGTYAANRMKGDPVWGMLIGGPSSGKTEPLAALGRCPYVTARSSISGEAALLSGTPKREKAATASGGLLNEIGAFGVVVLKDFTSILSMKHEQRATLMAALREIYDGSWTRSVGADGGRTLSWAGKVGMIAGCTSIIDSHHAVIGAMGERFVFYRLPAVDAEKQADRALDNDGQEIAMRDELSKAIADLMNGIDFTKPAEKLSDVERVQMTDLVTLAVRCRSAVERDGRTREILQIPDAEAPARLAGVLSRLLRGMTAIGVDRAEAWQRLAKVATDSMPALRWAAFQYAAQHDAGVPVATVDFATELRHPTVTVRRALQDLNAHGLLVRSKRGSTGNAPDLWELDDWAREKHRRLEPLFRACVGSVSENPPCQGVVILNRGDECEKEGDERLGGDISDTLPVHARKEPVLDLLTDSVEEAVEEAGEGLDL